MTEYLELGSSPYDESCAQVGSPNYGTLGRRECVAFAHQMERILTAHMSELGLDRDTAALIYFTVKSFPHDFGTYYETVVRYDDRDETAGALAFWCENNSPANWDTEARRELGI